MTNPRPRTRRAAASPVQVRSMSNPKPGWDLAQAVDLLRQGYSADHVEARTGFAAAHVLAQLRRTERERRAH